MLFRGASLLRQPVLAWTAAVIDLRFYSPVSIRAHKHAPSNRKYLTSKVEIDVKGTTADSTPHILGSLPSASTPRSSDTYTTEYKGPLAPTYRRLKIFSLASMSLTAALSPFMFIIESNLPTSARTGLAAIALTTSGVSTVMVGWCGKPYVETLRHIHPNENDGIQGLEMTTLSIFLRKRITRVYDVDFLVQTNRGFATWELADRVAFAPSKDGAEPVKKTGDPGQEETVAETLAADGEVLGRWIVKWEEGGVGKCRQVGYVVQHFNVHEELLT